jgi:hypothetical protein
MRSFIVESNRYCSVKQETSKLSFNIQEMTKIAKMFNRYLSGINNAMTETFSNTIAERLNVECLPLM